MQSSTHILLLSTKHAVATAGMSRNRITILRHRRWNRWKATDSILKGALKFLDKRAMKLHTENTSIFSVRCTSFTMRIDSGGSSSASTSMEEVFGAGTDESRRS